MPTDTFQELDFMSVIWREKVSRSKCIGSVFDVVPLYSKWSMNTTKMLYFLQNKIKLARYYTRKKTLKPNQNQSTIKNTWKMFTKLALLSHIWETVFGFPLLQAFFASRISKDSALGGGIGQVPITSEFRHSNVNWISLTCAFHDQQTVFHLLAKSITVNLLMGFCKLA